MHLSNCPPTHTHTKEVVLPFLKLSKSLGFFLLGILNVHTRQCTPGRLVQMKRTSHTKCWQGCGATGALLQCRWEWNMVQSVWKTVGHFLKCSTYTYPMIQAFYKRSRMFTKYHVLEYAEQDSLKWPQAWGSSKDPTGEQDKWGFYVRCCV